MTRLALALACTLAGAPSAYAGELFVFVTEDGTVHVRDQREDARSVVWRPGLDFEARALRRGRRPRAGRTRVDAPRSPFEPLVEAAAARYGVDPALVKAVVAVESAFEPWAVSRAGAQGLMQIMPTTGLELGLADPFDPAANVDAGTRYLATLLSTFEDEALALAAYNAGPGRVVRAGGVPDIPETRAYVEKVQRLRQAYRRSK